MKNLNESLLESINLIQEASVDAELEVCSALINEYYKQADILAYADEEVVNEFAIIQEGFFMEADAPRLENKELKEAREKEAAKATTKTEKKELLIVRIFKTIGHAIATAWKWITDKLSKAWNWLKEKLGKKKEDVAATPEVIKDDPKNVAGLIEGQKAEEQKREKHSVLAIAKVLPIATELETLVNEFIKMYNDANGTPDANFKKRLAKIKKSLSDVEYEDMVNTREGIQTYLIAPMSQGNYKGESRAELSKKLCDNVKKIGDTITSSFGNLTPVKDKDKELENYINAYIEDARVIQSVIDELNKCGAEIATKYSEMIFGKKEK